ncbi:MAG: hypothetical protein JNN12_09175 [Bacteroidetes Order II. Incertae sedis bacterium]|nr:hypothetical protein [Bacteroidetes Order II. bacterium]
MTILTDRDLTAEEQKKCTAQIIIDLRQTGIQSTHQDAILQWLDRSDKVKVNGIAVKDFCAIKGESYWLHVRARIFYRLFRMAQQLDRLPTDLDLTMVTEIYTHSAAIPFWRVLIPHANLHVVPLHDQKKKRPVRFSLSYLKHLLQLSYALNKLPKEGIWVFSNIFYNQLGADGVMTDRVFDPLLTALGPNARRLELLPIPPKGLEQLPHLLRQPQTPYPNTTLDAILIKFLLYHPQKIFHTLWQIGKYHRRLNNKTIIQGTFTTLPPFWESQFRDALSQSSASIPVLHLVKQSLHRFFGEKNPTAVIGSSENNSIGRTVVEAAKTWGIPTIGYQHGSIDRHNADYRFAPHDIPAAIPDLFCCWGDEVREYLVSECHYPPEKTVTVGRLVTGLEAGVVPNDQITRFKDAQQRPILLFASQAQGMFDEVRTLSGPLLAQFCVQNHFSCVVKPHPRETDDGLYRQAFAEAGIIDRLLEIQDGLFPMLAAADVGATCYSTVGWEMMWMGLPLLLLDPLKLDLLKLRSAPFVYTISGHKDPPFRVWMEHLAEHKAAGKQAAIQKLGPLEGNAAARILALLHKP